MTTFEGREHPWADAAIQMNQCEYLFAGSLREVEELSFEVIINEAKAQPVVAGPGLESDIFSDYRPIEADPTCKVFRVLFEAQHMVSYTVLNESFGSYPEPPEEFTGKLFRIFTKSHLLDFIRRTTIASDEYPAPLHHYQIACQNHVIDVIATGPPRIWI